MRSSVNVPTAASVEYTPRAAGNLATDAMQKSVAIANNNQNKEKNNENQQDES